MTSKNIKDSFAEATKLIPLSQNTYSADFPDEWSIGSVPHGGYITSVFLCVAQAHFSSTLKSQNQPHTIALHLDFLRRTQIGPALFTVTTVKLGRQTSIISIVLTQNDLVEVTCTLTQSNIFTETGVSFDTNWELAPKPLAVDLKKLSNEGEDENWRVERESEMVYTIFRKATMRTEFAFPKQGQRRNGSADEWVRPRNGDRWTNTAIGYLSDTWPMPVESFIRSLDGPKPKGPGRFWYPTLLLNLDIKKPLPEEGVEWLFVRAEAKQIRNGRMDVDVTILDEAGEIVALSQHVAFAVDVERNSAQRKNTVDSKI